MGQREEEKEARGGGWWDGGGSAEVIGMKALCLSESVLSLSTLLGFVQRAWCAGSEGAPRVERR
eukprot:3470044-Rhodomonas_salina.1